jgi:hypothetical protein
MPRALAKRCWRGVTKSRRFVHSHVPPRTSSHVRHWHKYARAKLPAHRCFQFHADAPEPAYDSTNLEDFHRGLTACAPATIRFHVSRADFSRWIHHVIHDDELSAAVRELESKISAGTADVDVDVVRTGLLSAIEDRYLEKRSLARTSAVPAAHKDRGRGSHRRAERERRSLN